MNTQKVRITSLCGHISWQVERDSLRKPQTEFTDTVGEHYRAYPQCLKVALHSDIWQGRVEVSNAP